MEKNWRAIKLADIATIRSGRDIYEAERIAGDTPYVTSGTRTNGVGYFVGNSNNTLTKNVVVLNRNGAVGHAYYHPYNVLVSNDCRTVEINEPVQPGGKAFLAHSITEQRTCFSYSRKLGTARAKQMRIMLPVDDDGKPDWDYMSSCSETLRGGLLLRYREYLSGRLSQLEYKEIPALDEVEWGLFRVGDLFDVKRPTARNKDDYDDGDIPFVASGAVNNGVMKCCNPKSDEKLDKGQCITVSPVDGSTFYQPIDFLGRGGAGSSILMLYNEEINRYSGHFISCMIWQTCSKYTYGHMGSKDTIKRELIQLPSVSGKPDFAYMEQYAKNLMLKKYRQYLDYIDGQTASEFMKGVLTGNDSKEWHEFTVDDVFTISSGKRLEKRNMVDGMRPFIGASDAQNGVTAFVGNENESLDSNVLGINYNGSVCEAFYHAYGSVFSDDVKRLHLKDHPDNKLVLLFMSMAIRQQKTKYEYAYKFNEQRMKRQTILLPVAEDGLPDYAYMEAYARSVTSRKIEQYKKYVLGE